MQKVLTRRKIYKLTNSVFAIFLVMNVVIAYLAITSFATSKTASAAVDTTNPVITKVFPFDNQHISGNKIFHIKATDSGPGNTGIDPTSVTMRLWDGIGTNDSGVLPLLNGAPTTPNDYRVKYQTALLPDGSNYQVDFYAEDNAGNSATYTVNSITIDNTKPTGSFTSPLHRDTVAGIVDIRGSGADLNISGYNIIIRDSSSNIVRIVQGSVGGNFVDMSLFSWNTFLLPNGDYRLDLHIKDEAGNGSSSKKGGRINLTVANVAPVITVDSVASTVGSPKLTGTIDDTNATISVKVDGTSYSATNNGDGTWTLPAGTIAPDLISGTYDVMATATNINGIDGVDTSTDELTVTIPGSTTGGSSGGTTSPPKPATKVVNTTTTTTDFVFTAADVVDVTEPSNDKTADDQKLGETSSTNTDNEGATQGEKTDNTGEKNWLQNNWLWLLALLIGLLLIFFWARRRNDEDEE